MGICVRRRVAGPRRQQLRPASVRRIRSGADGTDQGPDGGGVERRSADGEPSVAKT